MGATGCSTDIYKWLEYLFQSLGKHFIRLQHIKIFEAEQKASGTIIYKEAAE